MTNNEEDIIEDVISSEYKYGFTTDLEYDLAPIGLNEDIIRLISEKKNEPAWLLEYRLNAYRVWCEMEEPSWAHLNFPKPEFQKLRYYAAPKKKPELESLDQVDPELLDT